jgi:hypothetical protein
MHGFREEDRLSAAFPRPEVPTMKNNILLRSCGALVVAASVAACGYQDTRDATRRTYDSPTTVVNVPEPRVERTTVTVTPTPAPAPSVVYIKPDVFSERIYYVNDDDKDVVYFYEERDPSVVVRRRVVQDGDKTYYVEYSGDTERRVYFDRDAALARRLSIEISDRARLEREAAERDEKERAAWETRWKEMRERHESEIRDAQAERDRLERERLERENNR